MNLLVKSLAYSRPSIMVDVVIIIMCEGHLFWSIQNLVPIIGSSSCSSYNISNFLWGSVPPQL